MGPDVCPQVLVLGPKTFRALQQTCLHTVVLTKLWQFWMQVCKLD